jgi:hypothetical protein
LMTRHAISPRLAIRIFLNMVYPSAEGPRRGPFAQKQRRLPGQTQWRLSLHVTPHTPKPVRLKNKAQQRRMP